MPNPIATLGALCCMAAAASPCDGDYVIREASGILVRPDGLYLVGDDSPGEVLRLPLDRLPTLDEGVKWIGPKERATRIAIEDEPKDLEDIALLDGQLVVVSERKSKANTVSRTVLRYEDVAWIDQTGSAGIEGLAIRAVDDQTSMVAVLVELGGSGKAAAPSLGVHRTVHAPKGARLELRALTEHPVDVAGLRESAGLGNDATLRGTAVVWYRWPRNEWGLIVLISERSAARRKWLLRTDARGRTVDGTGSSFQRLADLLPDGEEEHNWEGLAWGKEGPADGASLVLVADNGATADEPKQTRIALIELPAAWR